MSSIEEKLAALEAEIAESQAERRAATAEERKDRLLDAITALRTQQTELMRLSGNSTDYDLNNPAVFHFWN